MPTWDNFAGQEVASGVRSNEPVIAFENESTRTVLNNLGLIDGLIPKIGKVMFRECRIFDNPLDTIFKKTALPFGVGFEDAEFTTGGKNKKNDGTCVPIGNPSMESQINLINLAWSIDVSIKDREINKAVLTPEEAGQFVAQKMQTPRKTLAMLKYRAETQIISDVIDGTRSISSTESSDGTGTSVTYSPTVKGYAGAVKKLGFELDPLTQGTVASFAQASDAMDMVIEIQNAATEMQEEGTYYSKLGINTFSLEKPNLVIEEKVLNALDKAWALDGTNKMIPTRTAREFLSTFCDVVSFPGAFAALPTNTSYSDYRLAAVLIDKDSCTEAINWEDVESQRCAKERLTGYNFGGASAMSIYRGNPACAFLTEVSSE